MADSPLTTAGGRLVVTQTDMPGLFDAKLYDAEGIFVREYRELTTGQVRHIAGQYGAAIEGDDA